jgi:uncharacterized membrane protein YdfJ with MMPL/SSD domain
VNRLLWLQQPAAAWALAALVLALGLALIPLSIAARQNPLATAGPQIAIAAPFAAVGLVIARSRTCRPNLLRALGAHGGLPGPGPAAVGREPRQQRKWLMAGGAPPSSRSSPTA